MPEELTPDMIGKDFLQCKLCKVLIDPKDQDKIIIHIRQKHPRLGLKIIKKSIRNPKKFNKLLSKYIFDIVEVVEDDG